jgi:6-phosphofructokinase 1
MSGIAGGAEAIVIPEVETTSEALVEVLRDAYARGKTNGIIVVAEGAKYDAETLYKALKQYEEQVGYELRMTILGHVQRGGNPGAFDRLLASRLGAEAAHQLCKGNQGVLVGWLKGEATPTPYAEVVSKHKPLDLRLFQLADELAR